MCYVVDCATCGKKTWKGCGRHAEQVMSSVPSEDKCECRTQSTAGAETTSKVGEAGKK
ncbi:hypothetical protein BKA62DRAFT_716510 [Auriculariales sp. MPI-PUGE-AT-0066]|nr:hypothetical protein BKA62DRAFT_716510 [Auriculariales sp. MPI-PUGE-AT-0066]